RVEEALAEADVGEPALAARADQQRHVIELGRGRAVGAGHARGEHLDLEAEGAEKRGEGAVQLVAEAAAALGDDLVEDALLVRNDLAAEVDVEVLEGDGEEVALVEGAEHLGRGVTRAGVGDAGEVLVDHRDLRFVGHGMAKIRISNSELRIAGERWQRAPAILNSEFEIRIFAIPWP